MRTRPQEFKKLLNLVPLEMRDQLVFIPLQAGCKEPAVPRGESWKDPLYRLVPEAALDRLEAGGNVGLVATKETLAFLDIERENIHEANQHVPRGKLNTLVTRTRNGGLHLYYLNSGLPNRDFTINGKKIIELRADYRYVVAPGSFVRPDEGGGGSGLYRIVNEQPPIPLTSADLPWLSETHEYKLEPVSFDGEFLSLPCVKVLFEVKLTDGRKVHGSKLLAIAWVKDRGSVEGFAPLARRYAAFQNRPGQAPIKSSYVVGWARNALRTSHEWNCGEMITFLRNNGVYPPCNNCPLKGAR